MKRITIIETDDKDDNGSDGYGTSVAFALLALIVCVAIFMIAQSGVS